MNRPTLDRCACVVENPSLSAREIASLCPAYRSAFFHLRGRNGCERGVYFDPGRPILDTMNSHPDSSPTAKTPWHFRTRHTSLPFQREPIMLFACLCFLLQFSGEGTAKPSTFPALSPWCVTKPVRIMTVIGPRIRQLGP